MPMYTLPQSVRKHIRLSKAAIRRQVLDVAEQKARISKLYEDMVQRYQTKGVKTQESVSQKAITIQNNTFTPNRLTVKPGEIVVAAAYDGTDPGSPVIAIALGFE